MMSVDPVDDCTFWYTTEYYETTSVNNWQTRIASFMFPGCTAPNSGTLNGTVTDTLAAPIEGVTISADDGAAIQLSTVTAADGTYNFASLPVGTYTVTAEKLGYVTGTAAGTIITDSTTATLDFILAEAAIYNLSGTVTDVNTGWPLYAEVDYTTGSVWTDPLTGTYSVDLPEGTYSVVAVADDYAPTGASVNLTSNIVQDFGLQVDATCSAPGYSLFAVLSESFAHCVLPSGWTITNLGTDCEWIVSDPDPGATGNFTGGAGCFADADVDFCGDGTTDMNTELISPIVDCSGLTAVTLEFKYDLDDTWLYSSTYNVDVSVDNGATWTNVWARAGTDETGTAQIDISAEAAGQSSVQVRFHYTSTDWDFWWQVDDVFIYENESDKTTCIAPANGGLVIGNVYDENTNNALNGVLVDDGAGYSVTTVATPDDDNIDDGFYSLYVEISGTTPLTASMAPYGPVIESVTVPLFGTVEQHFNLPAGMLSAAPNPVEVHIALNSTLSTPLDILNTGGLSADFSLTEMYAPAPTRPNGPFADVVRHVSPKHLYDKDASSARFDYPAPNVPVIAAAGDVLSSWATGLDWPWGVGFHPLSATLWLADEDIALSDINYEFALSGTATGNSMDLNGLGGAEWMADLAYDSTNETLWQMVIGGDSCIHELDTLTLSVTGNSICPTFGNQQHGLAYNPKTDTFYAGGWNDSTIHEFDRSGTILRSTNVGLSISGLAFNPVTDHLFVMVNDVEANSEIYIVDVPASGDFTISGQFSITGWSDYGGAGLAMDCDGHLWAVEQNTDTVYEVDSSETSTCSLDIPWLTESPTNGTVATSSSLPVTLNFDSTGLSAGTEEGYLKTINSTPYGTLNIPVTMVVEPDQSLTVSKDGSGAGNVSDGGTIDCGATCNDDYPYNTMVTLTAAADSGSTFMGWSGDCSGNGVCTVTMDQSRSVSATFTNTDTATNSLTVNVSGSGSGGVTSGPTGIFCGTAGTTCTAPFDENILVSLYPATDPGSTFTGWFGDCTGTGGCAVTMDQLRNVSAVFTAENDFGMLEGTVRNSLAAPIDGATITASDGVVLFSTATATDGSYNFGSVPAGTYAITAEKYGYVTQTATGVAVVASAATIQDLTLADAPFYTLSGTVTDTNTGQPLYAEVDYGFGSVWSNPVTGFYSASVAEGSYTVTAAAANYDTGNETVNLAMDTVQDFLLRPDMYCSAPGYSRLTVFAEDFDGCSLPSDWTVNNLGGDCTWDIFDPLVVRSNNTGGTGCYASADSEYCGSGTTMDTELISPSFDLSGLTLAALEFKYDIESWAGQDTFEVDISIDNGITWTNVWERLNDDSGPKTATVDITTLAAGEADVLIRFHYISTDHHWWWQVDEFLIFDPACIAPTDGGFIVGNVYDTNTNNALNGVLVDDGAGHSMTTMATPDDDNLDDGFYSLYFESSSGPVTLTASKSNYDSVTEADLAIPVLDTYRVDFNLPTGILVAAPDTFEVHIALDSTLSEPLNMINIGTASADFTFIEIYAPAPTTPIGPFAKVVRHVSPEHLYDLDNRSSHQDTSSSNYLRSDVPVLAAAGDVIQSWPSGATLAWGIDYHKLNSTIWVNDNQGAGGDGLNHEYSEAGVLTGQTVDTNGVGGAGWLADFAFDTLNRTQWQLAVGGDNCIHEINPATLLFTGNTICPNTGISQRGLAYNLLTDTFYVGGWNDDTIYEFDRSGTILRSTNLGLGISGLAFNMVTNHLFVMVNSTGSEVYVVDVPDTGDFSVLSQFDITGFADYDGAGLAMDCNGTLWAASQGDKRIYQVDSGETSTCNLDIPWLTETPVSGTVEVGIDMLVDLNFDSNGLAAGTEEGFLKVTNSTPYGSFNIAVTMIVEPDQLLTITRDGSGSGDVVANDGLIVDCGGTCSGDYRYNTEVTLTATATTGTFMGWSGDCIDTNPVCTITMDQARDVTAFFSDPDASLDHDLGVGVTGSGTTGSVQSLPVGITCGSAGSTCLASFADGVLVELTATWTSLDDSFMGWGGACSGNTTCTVTMDQAQYVSAIFTSNTVGTSLLEVLLPGNGQGSVISAPSGIFCGTAGTACSGPFDDGVSVTLTAAAATGATFTGWSGDCSGSSPTCDLTMDQGHSASAIFTLDIFNLTVTKDGRGDGLVTSTPAGIDCGSNCSGSYDYGTQVVLTAMADSHSVLANWQGSCNEAITEPPSPTCTVDILQTEDITVIFDHVFPWPMFMPAMSGAGDR